MKKPELKLPKVSLEIPEGGKARKIAVIVIAVLLVLMLALTIIFRVLNARQSGGVQAIRRAGVLRAAVVAGSRIEEHPEERLTEKEAGLVRDIADQLGVEIEYVSAADAEDALVMVRDKNADLAVGSITAGSVSKTMASRVALSRAYDTQTLCAVTRRGDYSDSTKAFEGRKIFVSPSVKSAGFEPFPEAKQGTDSVSVKDAYEMLGDHYLEGYICTAREAVEITAMGKDVQSQLMSGEDGLSFTMATASAGRELLTGINQIITIRSEETAGGN